MKYSIKKRKFKENNYIYCLLTCGENLEKTINIYKHFISRLIKYHGKFIIYSFNESKIKNNFRIYKLFKPKTLEIKNIKNSSQFLEEIKDKQLFAIDAIGRSILNFKERFLINKKNIHLIFIMNIGFISNESYGEKIDINFRNQIFRLVKYLNKFFFRMLVLLNIFPRTKFYFDSRKQIVEKFNNSIVRRLIVKFSSLKFLLNYDEIEKINCNAYEGYHKHKHKNKTGNIIFIDGNYKHQDMLIRDGKKILSNEKQYLSNLAKSLKILEKFFKKKVEIMLHPSTNFKDYKKLVPSFKIKKGNTDKKIYNSSIVIFHESSSVIDAVISKKKIISFDTNLLGNYLKNRINLYKDEFKTFSIDIDNFFSISKSFQKKLFKEINANSKELNKYRKNNLMSDGKTLPSDRVINKIEQFILEMERNK
mgnify:CR=1 FL=1|tara:strand:+ start:1554 stop:2816 length:1263 start_codon:yes stop_codon:yes gene_type:complete